MLEEIGLSGEDGLGGHHDYSFTPMSALTAGLKNVSVVGRVLGCKTFSTEDGRSFSRLRLWDGTGAVDVMVWESEQSASVGDVVAVWNGYVSTPKSGSGLVLHTGSRSRVEKMQDLGKL
ncbi:MAG: OB-fold nucleic acid binding domain-containing protein, partial [Candidatus Caldarchaeum sp.]